MQIVAGDEALALEARASHDTARCDTAAQAHQHALLLVGLVEGGILGRRRPAGTGRGADDALGAGFRGGRNHDAIGVGVGENDVDTRQRFHLAHVELGLCRVLPNRLVIVDDLAVSIGEAERS